MDKKLSINEYCILNIKRCADHLEHLREVIDISDGINEVSEKVNGNKILNEFEQAVNFNSLITIADLESTIILKNLASSSLESEKKYFIKLAYLIIFETFNSYDNYRKELKDISLRKPELTDYFTEINHQIKEFKREYDFNKTIYQVRNKTIGHIHKDFKLYHSIVTDIEYSASLKMFGSFIRLLNQILEFSVEILSQSDGTDFKNVNIDEEYNKLRKVIFELRSSKN